MKILVTGSTGFIGGMLCRALVARGHEVRAFHRATSNLTLLENLPVEHILGDLTRPETLAAAMEGVEAIFHTAALLGSEQAGRLYTITVEGTRAVLEAARRAGVRRLVHTSSVAALGVPEMGMKFILPLDENHSWNYLPERWPYGFAKHLAEIEVQKAVAQGLDAVIVNPSIVIGAGDVYRQSSSIVVQTARRHIPVLIEGGSNVVHIDDVIAGHLAALELGKTGCRYILGGENLTHLQFIQKITAVVGGRVPALVLPAGIARAFIGPLHLVEPFLDLPVTSRTFNLAGYHFYYDNSRAQVELGLDPPRSTEAAIQDAYEWFLHVGAIEKN